MGNGWRTKKGLVLFLAWGFSLLPAIFDAASAADRPAIPSLNAITASTSGPLFIPYVPAHIAPYYLNSSAEGPTLQAATPKLPQVENEADSGFIGIAKGPVLGKTVFAGVKDFVERGSLKAGQYVFGDHFTEGMARFIARVANLFDQAVITAESPALWDVVLEFVEVSGTRAAWWFGVGSMAFVELLDSNNTGPPHGQEFYGVSGYNPQSGGIYAGVTYGPNGQFTVVNPYTPLEFAPPNDDQPAPTGISIFDCGTCQQDQVCWCFCPQSMFDDSCGGAFILSQQIRGLTGKVQLQKNFTPLLPGTIARPPG